MDVLVVGGTGFIGTPLCMELDDRGHDVTALSRTPTDSRLPDRIETIAGDATDEETMQAAAAGRDVIVNLVALSPLFEPPEGLTHYSVHLGATETAVGAAIEQNVDRFVQMSALGADPEGATEYLKAKGLAEQVVRDTELAWTIFRPSVVFGDGGEFVPFLRRVTWGPIKPLPGGGKTRFQPIWVQDLVEMLATATVEPGHENACYELGGPEVYSLAALTRLLHDNRGTIVPIPMELVRAGATIAEALPGVPFGPDQARALQSDNVATSNDVTAFDQVPEDLRSLSEYLES